MVIVFDLDDTLYPEIEFVKSGFRAIARRVAPQAPLSAWRTLMAIRRREGSGRVFNQFAEETGLALNIPELIDLYRFHAPAITLGVEERIVLEQCRADFNTALITDGPARTQRNKFAALGLSEFIEFPLFTDELRVMKPDPLPFRRVMERFPGRRRFVYIGDNPAKDFQAPAKLGWRTIRIKRAGGVYSHLENNADREVGSLLEAEECLRRLIADSAWLD